MKLKVRKVTGDDCQNIYKWRSFHLNTQYSKTTLGSYEDHCKWFDEHEGDIMIVELDSIAICVVRADNLPDGYRISIYMRPGFHHRGWGKLCLLLSEKYITEKFGKRNFTAEILPENEASIKMFTFCGYRKDGDGQIYRKC